MTSCFKTSGAVKQCNAKTRNKQNVDLKT